MYNMNDDKIINSHYLSISYQILTKNKIIHFFLFLFEICLIFLQLLEIYIDDFKILDVNKHHFNPLTYLIIQVNKLSPIINFLIYTIIIVVIIINFYIFNYLILNINLASKVMINLSELLFYRLLSLALFNYLFVLKDIYFMINIISTIIYVFILILNFYKNHLFLFFPSLINYPYDSFSMIIDLFLLLIKIFISSSRMTSNENISKLCFIISISIHFFLLIYLSYIMIYKSYYLMNNITLNITKYSVVLSISILIIVSLLIDKSLIFNVYSIISYCNIFIIFLLSTSYFYDPYKYIRFESDDNVENIFYYFFMIDRNKNQHFLIEKKIEEHVSKCNRCNLCKKYNKIKYKSSREKENVDLYKIIYNCKEHSFNLMNKIIRRIKMYGKDSFINNYYFLINIIYTYCIAINRQNYNVILNTELLFEIINSENKQFLEDNNISLNRIKYTNNFFIKVKKIIQIIYDIFEEKKLDKKIQKFFQLGEDLEELKFNEIKSSLNGSVHNSNYNSNIEGLPNCTNLLTICSLFYEELYNETISNSGVTIRDSANILEELITNNSKNSNQITLEINIQSFNVKIIRAGGEMNKYVNKNFFEFFPSILKNKQIIDMKSLLFYSDDYSSKKSQKSKKKHKKLKNGIEIERQNINFNFIIEVEENNELFCRLLKLKLSLILLTNINKKIYLNGVYVLNSDIIVTEETKDEEILLYFGNEEQSKLKIPKDNNNKIIIKSNKNEKFLGNKKLVKTFIFTIGYKIYNIYYFLILKKKNKEEKADKNKEEVQDIVVEEENANLLEKDNNEMFLYNDIASQAISSVNNSTNKNNVIAYNRENKHNLDDSETKELRFVKYILIFTIIIFLIILILLSFYLTKSYQNLKQTNNLYLSFQDFFDDFYNLFFSVLSLGCLSEDRESKVCRNYMSDLSTVASRIIQDFIDNGYSSEESTQNQNFDDLFIDFSKFLFYQNQFLTQRLNDRLSLITKNLSIFKGGSFTKNFNINIMHYIINQNFIDNKIILSLKKQNITFNDFNLLMISRFSVLTKDINDIRQPIYILNKTGDQVFNNILVEDKLTSFQENFYLIILDFKVYSENFNLIINKISDIVTNTKKSLKQLIYTFINFILFFTIVSIIMSFAYIVMYLIIILKTLEKIFNEFKEKIGNSTIQDIMKEKIDNLNLLLNFYENDINETINNLNKIYEDYKDNYNLKVKEELKLLKREGKKEVEKINQKPNIMKLIKRVQENKLFEYSGKKNTYLYIFSTIITLGIIIYIICIIIWIVAFNKYNKIIEWKNTNQNVSSVTKILISNYLIMIYNNKTLEEISDEYDSKDFISYIYSELMPFYGVGKYDKYIKNMFNTSDIDRIYDCKTFYRNLDSEIFKQIRQKFEEEENKFDYTLSYFCTWSNLLYKNYRTIYLQLFGIVKKGMESFKNVNYKDIIEFLNQKNVIKIDVMYMIVYIYLIELMHKNIKKTIVMMISKIGDFILITNLISFPIVICLIFTIFFVYVKNVNNDCKKFIHIRKIFRVCNTN